MNETAMYPHLNVFSSQEWSNRILTLGLNEPRFYTDTIKGFKAAFLTSGLTSDFEDATSLTPRDLEWLKAHQCDWIFYRKLLSGETFSDPLLKTGAILPYSNAPYLDLTQPLSPQKEPISHVHRCERKLTREIGPPELCEAITREAREEWFELFVKFQTEQNRLPEFQKDILRKWILAEDKPAWMKILSLKANDTVLATGLFYLWQGTFYYYASAMNPEPSLRKYGGGKLFVDKLIHYAQNEGARVFDFLQGDHAYKQHWNPAPRPLYQFVGAISLKGVLALKLLKFKFTLNQLASARDV